MIFDLVKNAYLYKNVLPNILEVLEKGSVYTKDNYPVGRVDIDGDNLFLNLNTYETHFREEAFSEAHQQYVDVMYMVEGEEIIYVKPTEKLLSVTKPYDSKIDALLAKLDDDAIPVRLCEGSFIVLFPQDSHAPGCCVDTPKSVKKIVAKIKL